MTLPFNNITVYLSGKRKYAELFFIIFYTVGFFGLIIPSTHHLFLRLFPLALILSFTAILIFHYGSLDSKTIIVLSLIGISSYIIEVAGVNTHIIFGNYRYGDALGIKLLNTPLLIAVNWVMLTYTGSSITERFPLPVPMKIIFASLLILIYDIILEQVAMFVDLWYWEGIAVPFRNYMAWFIIALAFQIVLKISGIKIRNSFAWKIILIQALFFLLLIVFFKFMK